MTRVLVTGAEGFSGLHLTEMLVSQGYQVKALAQYNPFNHWGWLEGINGLEQIDIFMGDVRDPPYCHHITRGVDIVFHLAALIVNVYSYITPDSYMNTNINGTVKQHTIDWLMQPKHLKKYKADIYNV